MRGMDLSAYEKTRHKPRLFVFFQESNLFYRMYKGHLLLNRLRGG